MNKRWHDINPVLVVYMDLIVTKYLVFSLFARDCPFTDMSLSSFELKDQLVAPRSAPESVTLLEHIVAIVESIIAPMKRRILRKRKKPSNPKMNKPGIPNDDTTMVDVSSSDIKLDTDEAFLSSLKDVGAAAQKYDTQRQELKRRELETSWDYPARLSASEDEQRAATIIWKIREDERDNLFGNKASEAIPGPETLDMGGQFLTNKKRIEKSSRLFQIAKQQPKGCHLHLHFNAELTPNELMARASQAPNMFIRSTEPLVDGEPGTGKSSSYSTTELVFNIMAEDTPEVNIFSPDYNGAFRPPGSRPWMRYRNFITEYEARHNRDGNDTAENFILSKMVLVEEEVYGNSQTTNGLVH